MDRRYAMRYVQIDFIARGCLSLGFKYTRIAAYRCGMRGKDQPLGHKCTRIGANRCGMRGIVPERQAACSPPETPAPPPSPSAQKENQEKITLNQKKSEKGTIIIAGTQRQQLGAPLPRAPKKEDKKEKKKKD